MGKGQWAGCPGLAPRMEGLGVVGTGRMLCPAFRGRQVHEGARPSVQHSGAPAAALGGRGGLFSPDPRGAAREPGIPRRAPE